MNKIILLYFILAYSIGNAQDTIVWDFNSKLDTNLIDRFLKIENVTTNDSIFIGESVYKLNCINHNIVLIQFKQLMNSDTFIINVCNDTLFTKMEDDKSIQLHKDERFSINFRYKILKSSGKIKIISYKDYIINKAKEHNENIYFDAKLLLNGSKIEKAIVLEKYEIDAHNQYLKDTLIQNQNDSIDIENDAKSLQNAQIDTKQEGTGKSKLISSILGLDVTTYVDGLSKFLVSRVKQELAIAYFNEFSSAIRDTNTRDIQVLFEKTYNVMDLISDRVYDFKPYIHAIREGMEEDFKHLPEAFNALVLDDSSQLSKSINTLRNMRFLANNLLALNISIKNNDHIGIALANLEPGIFLEKPYTDTLVIGAVQTLQLFSLSLKDSVNINDSIYWVSYNNLNELIQNDDFLNCFMGLLTQKAKDKNIRFDNNSSLYSILNDSLGPKKIKEFKGLLNLFKSTFGKIQAIHQKFNTSADMDVQGSLIAGYFDATHSLISTCNEFNNLFRLNQKKKINNLVTISSDISGIVKNISVKKYGIASIHLAHLIKEFDVKKSDWRWYNVVNFIVEKSLFISQMAEAKSSDEVDSLLQIYAAPIGSWRDKRESNWNIAFDSYVGAGGFFSNRDNEKINQFKDFNDRRYNLSSPVGLSFSRAIRNYNVTVLFSIVDIGPLTAFRFRNDTGEIHKITLNEIFSPGIQSSFYFSKKFPLTVNLGYQQYPLLKKVSLESNEYNLKKVPGFVFSLNMNIPIFTITNIKPESKEIFKNHKEKEHNLNLINDTQNEFEEAKLTAQNKIERKEKKHDHKKRKFERASEQLNEANDDYNIIIKSGIKN